MEITNISVILPSYNERDNIVPLIHELMIHLSSYDYEIIVVDDNSPDGTCDAVQALNLGVVRLIIRQQERSLARSIRCGLENATGDIFVVMDTDFNHKPEYLPFMIDSVKYFDCVSASRFLYGGMMEERVRNTASWLFNIFARIATGGRITDNLYGYFAVKREVISKVDYDKVFWGYGDYYIRLLYYLQRNGASILQFPAVNGRRLSGQGNRRLAKVLFQYATEVIRLALKGRISNV